MMEQAFNIEEELKKLPAQPGASPCVFSELFMFRQAPAALPLKAGIP